jgi:parallel beta-helix repeat protein
MLNKRTLQSHRLSIPLLAVPGALVIILAVLLTRPALTANAGTGVCGPITNDTTWTPAGSPYTVTCDVQVMGGVTLTVQSGVTVKFNTGTLRLRVDGTLIAEGCTFTSNDPTAERNDWGGILFTTTSVDAVFDDDGNYLSGSKIEDCVVEWGGGDVNGAIETDIASPFIHGNIIRNNGASGIHVAGRSPSQWIVISGNSVHGNSTDSGGNLDGGGICASNGYIIGNTIEGNSTYHGNGGGIYASASTATGNIVTANASGDGGGIYAVDSTLTGNIVSGNSGHNGGGIYAKNSLLAGNTARNNGVYDSDSRGSAAGGGIYAENSTVTSNTIAGNSANATHYNHWGLGGGVYARGGTVTENTVSGNVASGAQNRGQGGGIFGRSNTVHQNIVTGNTASEGSGIYIYEGTATANTVFSNTAHSRGALAVYRGMAFQNTVRGNTAAYGGGIRGNGATLIANTVTNNTAQTAGGGIHTADSTLQANTVTNNTAQNEGGGIYAEGGTLTNNTVSHNTVPIWGHGSGVYLVNVADFGYNTVATNTTTGGTAGATASGISISGQSSIHYNNVHGNQPYDAEVVSSADVDGIHNYWGLSPCTAIPGQIYDGDDMPGRGQLLYAPSLYSPVPLMQLSAPTNLTITTGTTSTLTLIWTPVPAIPDVGCRVPGSTDPDTGYRIYYDTDGPCPPYEGVGLDQGNSPIDVGRVTSLTLGGLSKSGYYFVITAYDYLGRESTYSNVVAEPSEQPDLQEIYLPLIVRNR